MKAKDTVITKEEMQLYCVKAYKDKGIDVSPFAVDMTCPQVLCETQAEISVKAGIKEVVETYRRELPAEYALDEVWWQARLKEWGVE